MVILAALWLQKMGTAKLFIFLFFPLLGYTQKKGKKEDRKIWDYSKIHLHNHIKMYNVLTLKYNGTEQGNRN